MQWFTENFSTIVVCIILAVLVFLAVRYLVKHKNSGGCMGCSGDCSKCRSKCSNKRK